MENYEIEHVLEKILRNQKKILKKLAEKVMFEKIQYQEWFSLEEACLWKGVNYNSISGNRRFQPNGGIPDGYHVGGRRWRRKTIEAWLELSDEDLCA